MQSSCIVFIFVFILSIFVIPFSYNGKSGSSPKLLHISSGSFRIAHPYHCRANLLTDSVFFFLFCISSYIQSTIWNFFCFKYLNIWFYFFLKNILTACFHILNLFCGFILLFSSVFFFFSLISGRNFYQLKCFNFDFIFSISNFL